MPLQTHKKPHGDEVRTYAPLEALHLDPANARKHPERNMQAVCASLACYGQQKPIVVSEAGRVIAGNGTLEAARSLGWTDIWVAVTSLSELQAIGYGIADNRTAELAEWDQETLAVLLAAVGDHPDVGFDATGFSAEELAAMTAGAEEPMSDAPEEGELSGSDEAQAKWRVEKGDTWAIGPHRLICGDCRDPKVVDRLFAGTKAALAFTSPPYAAQRVYDKESGFEPIEPDAYVDWFQAVQARVGEHLAPDGSFFVNIRDSSVEAQSTIYCKELCLAFVREWNWRLRDEFIWKKVGFPRDPELLGAFKNAWESVFWFTRARAPKFRPRSVMHSSANAGRSQGGCGSLADNQGSGKPAVLMEVLEGLAFPSNVLEIAPKQSGENHSAAFPIGLPRFFVLAYTDPGDIVFDPFSGSGTTIAAAHGEERVGYGCEISPSYCAVILDRLQGLGLDPQLVEDRPTATSAAQGKTKSPRRAKGPSA